MIFNNNIEKKNDDGNNFYDLDIDYINKTYKELIIEVNKKSFKFSISDIYDNFEEEKNTLLFKKKNVLYF